MEISLKKKKLLPSSIFIELIILFYLFIYTKSQVDLNYTIIQEEINDTLFNLNVSDLNETGGIVVCPPQEPYCFQISNLRDQASNFTLYEKFFSRVNMSEECQLKVNESKYEIAVLKFDLPINISLSEGHLRKVTYVDYQFFLIKDDSIKTFIEGVNLTDTNCTNCTNCTEFNGTFFEEINETEYNFTESDFTNITEDEFINYTIINDTVFLLINNSFYREYNCYNETWRNDTYILNIRNLSEICFEGNETQITILNPLYLTRKAQNYWLEVKEQTGYDAFDPTCGFYKQFCLQYTHDRNHRSYDVTPEQRRKQLFLGNMRLCPNECTYMGIDSGQWSAVCSCPYHYFNLSNINDLSFEDYQLFMYDEDDFYSRHTDSIHSIDVAKCDKIIFSRSGFRKNYISYVVLGFALVVIISFIVLLIAGRGRILNVIELIYNSNITIACSLKKSKHHILLDDLDSDDEIYDNDNNNYNIPDNFDKYEEMSCDGLIWDEKQSYRKEQQQLMNISYSNPSYSKDYKRNIKKNMYNKIKYQDNDESFGHLTQISFDYSEYANPPKKQNTRIVEKRVTVHLGPKDLREVVLKGQGGYNVQGLPINSNLNTITLQNRNLYYPGQGQGYLRDQFIERTNQRELKYQKELDNLILELERRREIERDRELEELLERYRRYRGLGVEYGVVGAGGGGVVNIGEGGRGGMINIGTGGPGGINISGGGGAGADININSGNPDYDYQGLQKKYNYDLEELLRLKDLLEKKKAEGRGGKNVKGGGGNYDKDLDLLSHLIKQREEIQDEQNINLKMKSKNSRDQQINGFNKVQENELRQMRYQLEREKRQKQLINEQNFKREKQRIQNEITKSRQTNSYMANSCNEFINRKVNYNYNGEEIIDDSASDTGCCGSCCAEENTCCGGMCDFCGCCGYVKGPSPMIALKMGSVFSDHEFLAMSFKNSLVYDRRSFCQYYLSLLNLKQPLFFLINADRSTEFSSFHVSYKAVTIIVFSMEIMIYFFYNIVLFGSLGVTRVFNGSMTFRRRVIYGSILFPVCLFTVSIMQFLVYFYPNVKLSEIKIMCFNSLLVNTKNKVRPNNFRAFLYSEPDDGVSAEVDIAPKIEGEELNEQMRAEKHHLRDEIKSLSCCILTSIIVSFIVLLGVFFFVWYITAGFGAIYKNTQGHWAINVAITFALANLFEFIYCLIPAAFRHCGTIKGRKPGCWIIARILTVI